MTVKEALAALKATNRQIGARLVLAEVTVCRDEAATRQVIGSIVALLFEAYEVSIREGQFPSMEEAASTLRLDPSSCRCCHGSGRITSDRECPVCDGGSAEPRGDAVEGGA